MSLRCLVILWVLSIPSAACAQPAKPRLDAHGFPLPDGAIARLGDLRFVQAEWIGAVALSPDGKVIATSGQRRIFLWSSDTGRIVREIPCLEGISALAFSSNGRLLAGWTWESKLMVWNVETGKPHWPEKNRSPALIRDMTALRFIDNDRLLAVAYQDCRVLLWDADQGTLTRTLSAETASAEQRKRLPPGSAFTAVSLSPSGERVAWLASPDRASKGGRSVAFIHETVSGRLLREVKELRPTEAIHLVDEGETLVLHPSFAERKGKLDDGREKYTVVNATDGRVRFHCDYRFAPALMSQPLMASISHFAHADLMRVFQSGKSLFTTDGIGTVRWDLATGKKLDWSHPFIGPALSADGTLAVIANRTRLYLCDENLNPTRPQHQYSDPANVHYLSHGRLVVESDGWGGGNVLVWDPKQGKVMETMRRHEAPPGDRRPCSFDSISSLFVHRVEKGVEVRDLVTDRRVCRLDLEVDNGEVVDPILSPDGSRVLVWSAGQKTQLMRWFDARTGKELGRYRIPVTEFMSNRYRPVNWFSKNGAIFGYVTPEGRLVLVDCRRSAVCRVLGDAEKPSNAQNRAWYECAGHAAFIVSRRDGALPGSQEFALWDWVRGQPIRRFLLQPGGAPAQRWYAEVSPDCRFVAVYFAETSEVLIHETATGRCRGQFRAPNPIRSLAFAPDGKTLATGCHDTTVLLWDLNRPLSGKPELTAPRTAAQADTLWQSLGDADAATMEPALWALVRAPEQSLPLLKQRLQAARSPERLRALIEQLDSSNYKSRETAARELTGLVDFAIPAMRATLNKGVSSVEQRRRIEDLLTHLEDPAAIPSCLRELRAIEVLERIGSTEARVLIADLAAGSPEAMVTREARLVLDRWPE